MEKYRLPKQFLEKNKITETMHTLPDVCSSPRACPFLHHPPNASQHLTLEGSGSLGHLSVLDSGFAHLF